MRGIRNTIVAATTTAPRMFREIDKTVYWHVHKMYMAWHKSWDENVLRKQKKPHGTIDIATHTRKHTIFGFKTENLRPNKKVTICVNWEGQLNYNSTVSCGCVCVFIVVRLAFFFHRTSQFSQTRWRKSIMFIFYLCPKLGNRIFAELWTMFFWQVACVFVSILRTPVYVYSVLKSTFRSAL